MVESQGVLTEKPAKFVFEESGEGLEHLRKDSETRQLREKEELRNNKIIYSKR